MIEPPVKFADLLQINDDTGFNAIALELFRFQVKHNPVYASWVNSLGVKPSTVDNYRRIPFLPVGLFKSHRVVIPGREPQLLFESSGTTGMVPSRHWVVDAGLYRKSFVAGFELFYGHVTGYRIVALLPSYLERKNASLVFMVDELIRLTGDPKSGFYLRAEEKLEEILADSGKKTILIGVSFALLEMAEKLTRDSNPALIVMETGGMKGRRREMIREELHEVLCRGFGVNHIHSEYGMTELLSQAYSKGEGVYAPPPWMKILIRDPDDPLTITREFGITGGINVIDLANIWSCPFIATEDLGRLYPDGRFTVLGRFDESDIRGCNLMAL
ncbi:MAG: acyltransferase [Bacteroidales bacterium]